MTVKPITIEIEPPTVKTIAIEPITVQPTTASQKPTAADRGL
ncbi:hypothetical protein [Streptomyces sp. NPDC006645]